MAASSDSRIAHEIPLTSRASPVSDAAARTCLTRRRNLSCAEWLVSNTWNWEALCGQPLFSTSGLKIMEAYCLGAVSTAL